MDSLPKLNKPSVPIQALFHCIKIVVVCLESSVASRAEILRDCAESNLLKAVAGQKLLPAIKVLTDWLRLNAELPLTCVEV